MNIQTVHFEKFLPVYTCETIIMIMSVPVNLHIFLMLFIVSLLALAIQITIYVHYITINCIFRIL